MTALTITNARIARCDACWDGAIELGSIRIENGLITAVEPCNPTTNTLQLNSATRVIDVKQRLVTPGLIDCHTHLIYAGNRAGEFQRRLQGESYAAIARSGGGIMSTVRATRRASLAELLALATTRIAHWKRFGFTSVEIKSGYGLDRATELKMLSVAQRLAHSTMDVSPTLLAAHALPPEYAGRPDDYIDWVCNVLIPHVAAQHLAEAVDVFCETIGFTLEQSQRVLSTAEQCGLGRRIHAEQLSNLNGSTMAAQLHSLSADHLEYLTESGVQALSTSGTVATLLPQAYYFLRETQPPPIATLRQYAVPMALGSDANPGSAPTLNPLLSMNMATTLFQMTPVETLLGMTRHAAKALGRVESLGSIEVGKRANLAVWNLEDAAELSYWMGASPCYCRIFAGQPEFYT